MIKLRDYQQDLYNSIRCSWQTVRSVLAVCPTGGGKTVLFSQAIHDHVGASAAIVHRKEIVGQISQALARLEVEHRVVAPPTVVALIRRKHLKEFGRSFVDQQAPCGVVSVQTLTSKSSERNTALQAWVQQVTLGVFDEGHHYTLSGLWGRAVEMLNNARLLFVTATPERADGQGLGAHADGFVDEMIEGPTTQWLIERGYLSKFRYVAPDTDLDVSSLATSASGDYTSKALRSRVVESHLVGDVVEHYRKFASGKRAIVFATDVETAHEMSTAFWSANYSAVALSGKTEQAERDREIDKFSNGETDVLVNVDLFDEGFDVPAVEAVILARPTESLGKFLQMVGRALRCVYAEGYDLSTVEGRLAAMANGDKPEAIVIDPVRNWERHGMPNWPRVWTLDSRPTATRSANSGLVPQRICLSCTQPYEKYYKACPYCGEPVPEPVGRTAPEQVEGDLTELDVDAMAALFKRMERADMDDDDYALDQLRRNMPKVGRGADMKRHQTNKARRAVLKELVAWWVGMQDGRELGEIHRRFYIRFGVDIGTAMTLKAKETDALIALIEQKFTEDLML